MRFLTRKEFAGKAKVSLGHVRGITLSGSIKSYKRNGRRLIPYYELHRFVARRKPLSQRLAEQQKRFTAKYGRGSFERFVELLKDSSLSLSAVGRKFNLTRERVRQLSEYLGYGSAWRKEMRQQQLSQLAAEEDGVLRFVKKRCEMFGLPFQPIKGNGRWKHICVINGKRVIVRKTVKGSLTSPGARTRYTSVQTGRRLKRSDFLVMLVGDSADTHAYVVPRQYYQRQKWMNFPVSPFVYPSFGQKEKYIAPLQSGGLKAQVPSATSKAATIGFLESWHLLRN